MQSLKDLALIVSEKMATLRGFFSQKELCQLFSLKISLNMCKLKSTWHDQQPYKVSTYSDKNITFSVKIDTALTLKYNQSHKKWYE